MPVTLLRFSLLPAACAAALFVAGCASPPPAAPPAAEVLPAQWQAPLPHDGQLSALSQWWSQFDDPLLVRLIESAQAVSPSIASAASRIEQSRATRVAASAALLPSLDANASAVRGKQDFVSGLATTESAGLQSSWELDLFGGRDRKSTRLNSSHRP